MRAEVAEREDALRNPIRGIFALRPRHAADDEGDNESYKPHHPFWL